MRVLLVYFNPTSDLVAAPPIGLSYVATATERAGHEVRFLDLFGRPDPVTELAHAVRSFAPDATGISVRNIDNLVSQRPTWHLAGLAPLLACIRGESRAPIVLGGPAVSILGPTTLRHLDADFAIVGEGEDAFPRLLATLGNGGGYASISGLCYRADGAVHATPPAQAPRFGASGMERWVDWRRYEAEGGTWAIQTQRGCSLHCIYCAYPLIEGRAARRRSAADVVDEIERVAARVGPRTFEFVDSTFNVPAGRAEEMCREIIRRRLRVNLAAADVNPLGVTDELFDLMRAAGFTAMIVTPESASDAMLTALRKGFRREHVERTARLATRSRIASAWFFMLGGPGETRETVDETVSFVERSLNVPGCLCIFMTGIRVLPGTELARREIREGRIPPDRDLAEPTFALSPDVPEDWIIARINRAIARCPGLVHAAEEGRSTYQRLAERALNRLGCAPPYWRFLPMLLRVPPIRALRRRHPPRIGRPMTGVATSISSWR